MSAPPSPGFAASTMAVARLAALRVLRGRKLRMALVATLVVVLFPAVVALVKDDADAATVVKGGIDWGFYRLLVFLLPILFTSGTVGEEVEARTLHFLAMRPLPRASIALGKFLVGAGAALAVFWIGLLALHLIGYAASPTLLVEQFGDTARAGGAGSLLLATYCAVCLFWGTLVPEVGGMASIIWLGVVEFFFGLLPGIFRFLSASHWARELGGIERAGWAVIEILGRELVSVPEVDLWIGAAVVGGELVLFLGLALLIMQTAQLRFGKA